MLNWNRLFLLLFTFCKKHCDSYHHIKYSTCRLWLSWLSRKLKHYFVIQSWYVRKDRKMSICMKISRKIFKSFPASIQTMNIFQGLGQTTTRHDLARHQNVTRKIFEHVSWIFQSVTAYLAIYLLHAIYLLQCSCFVVYIGIKWSIVCLIRFKDSRS